MFELMKYKRKEKKRNDNIYSIYCLNDYLVKKKRKEIKVKLIDVVYVIKISSHYNMSIQISKGSYRITKILLKSFTLSFPQF